MYNPSTNKKFKPPVGRLAQVQAIQNYSKMMRVKPDDYFSSDVRRNPKFLKKDDYITGIKEFPSIHKHVPHLQQGKPKKMFKDSKLFEMGGDSKKPKQKKEKKSPLAPHQKKVVLDYKSEFHVS